MAGLSEIAPAVARAAGRGGRTERRRAGCGIAPSPAIAGGDAARRWRADGPAAARPRAVSARRAGGAADDRSAGLPARPLRIADRLCRRASPPACPGADDRAGGVSLARRCIASAGTIRRAYPGMARAYRL